jgi:hypothetical protein
VTYVALQAWNKPHRRAMFKTRYGAEKAIHRLESQPEHWGGIKRSYPTPPDYEDETWHGDWECIGIVGVSTFIYDDLAKEFDPSPVRIMVEDDEGLAEAYLTIEVAEQVYEALGKAIQKAKDAQVEAG